MISLDESADDIPITTILNPTNGKIQTRWLRDEEYH